MTQIARPQLNGRLEAKASPRCLGGSGRHWSEIVFANVQRWRKARGMTVDEAVRAVRLLGIPMSRRIYYDISNGDSERQIGIDELLGFALALGVSPVKLMIPRAGDCPVAVGTATESTLLPAEALAWWLATADRRPPTPSGATHCTGQVLRPPAPESDDVGLDELLRDVSAGPDYIAAEVDQDLDEAFELACNPDVALFTITPSGTIETVNRAAEALAGRSASELVGRPAGDLVAGPLDPERPSTPGVVDLLRLDSGYVGRAKITRPEGDPATIAIVIKPEYDHDHVLAGYSCAAHRLAERAEARAAVALTTESATPDAGEVCAHLDGIIYLFSPRAEEICGLKASQAVGRVWKQIGLDPHLDTTWFTYVHNLFGYGHATWAQPFRRPDGESVLLRFWSRLQYDVRGDPDSISTLITPTGAPQKPGRKHRT